MSRETRPSIGPSVEHDCHTSTETTMTETAANEKTTAAQQTRDASRGGLAAVRDGVVSFVGAILAIVPHVLHHIGLIVGAAFLTGAGGTVLFYVLGLGFSIPMLRRLYRRFVTWRAPAIAIAVFTAVFSLSAFVIGPAISGSSTPNDGSSNPTEAPSQGADPHSH